MADVKKSGPQKRASRGGLSGVFGGPRGGPEKVMFFFVKFCNARNFGTQCI